MHVSGGDIFDTDRMVAWMNRLADRAEFRRGTWPVYREAAVHPEDPFGDTTGEIPIPVFGDQHMTSEQIWTAGDFSAVAATMVVVGENLVESAGIHPGERVLDVGTGSGNTALAAARRHAVVTGVDIVQGLLDRARERAMAERLPASFQLGDVQELPFANGCFDVVTSSFGAIFAPDPEKTSAEMMRVLKPGGRLVMANWTRSSFIGGFLGVHRQYVPAPPGARSPLEWGDRPVLEERLGRYSRQIAIESREFAFREQTARAFVEFMRVNYGPTQTTFERIPEDRRERFLTDLTDVAIRFNRSSNGFWCAPSEYVEVIATKR